MVHDLQLLQQQVTCLTKIKFYYDKKKYEYVCDSCVLLKQTNSIVLSFS